MLLVVLVLLQLLQQLALLLHPGLLEFATTTIVLLLVLVVLLVLLMLMLAAAGSSRTGGGSLRLDLELLGLGRGLGPLGRAVAAAAALLHLAPEARPPGRLGAVVEGRQCRRSAATAGVGRLVVRRIDVVDLVRAGARRVVLARSRSRRGCRCQGRGESRCCCFGSFRGGRRGVGGGAARLRVLQGFVEEGLVAQADFCVWNRERFVGISLLLSLESEVDGCIDF